MADLEQFKIFRFWFCTNLPPTKSSENPLSLGSYADKLFLTLYIVFNIISRSIFHNRCLVARWLAHCAVTLQIRGLPLDLSKVHDCQGFLGELKMT